MKKYLDIKGMKIVDSEGGIEGIIEDSLIDYRTMRICSLLIVSKDVFAHYYILPYDNICSIGEVVLYSGKVYRIKKSVLNKVKKYMFNRYLNEEVIDTKGCILGNMEDAMIDEDTGLIKAVICSRGLIEDIFEGKKIVMINKGGSFGKRKIIVEDGEFELYNDISLKRYTRG